MPTLKYDEIKFNEEGVAFRQGVCDEARVSLYEGEIDGYQLRFRIGDGSDMRHVYWKARIMSPDKFAQYDLPKIRELFGCNPAVDELINDSETTRKKFIGKTAGIRLKDAGGKFYVSLYVPKEQSEPDPEKVAAAKRRALAKLSGPVEVVAVPVETTDDLPF